MSDTTAGLRRKIGGAEQLQSVVRTMKSLAASSIGQYEKSVHALDSYFHSVELGLGVTLRHVKQSRQGVFHNSEALPKSFDVIVFGSDQGLVGSFNDVIAAHVRATLKPLAGPTVVWAVGERVKASLISAGFTPKGSYAVPGSIQSIVPLIGQILLERESQSQQADASGLYLIYNRPSGIAYHPFAQQLLPLDKSWLKRLEELPWPNHILPEVLGNTTETLRVLIREYLFVSIFRACAESLASENASRLAAMQRADKNISELLDGLQGSFHRLRQSSIDEELFDVVAGFEAIEKHV